NAGKSTLISVISAAKPKIADYPFTTLVPNLGVVSADDDETFVVADIPGLIEGAHEGHGLGDQFLRHVERCAVLLHLVDLSANETPEHDAEVVARELELYSKTLAEKPRIICGSKLDSAIAGNSEKLRPYAAQHGYDYFEISAVIGEGIRALVRAPVRRRGGGRSSQGRGANPPPRYENRHLRRYIRSLPPRSPRARARGARGARLGPHPLRSRGAAAVQVAPAERVRPSPLRHGATRHARS